MSKYELKEGMTNEEIRECIANNPEDYDTYQDVLEMDGANHELYMKGDVIRWKTDPIVEMLYRDLEIIDLNALMIGLIRKYGEGYKNDHRLRKFYRGLGYSLFGYWEIFFWDANNDEADEWIGEEADENLRGSKIGERQ